MPTGTVKWFNNAKGFGFILPEDGGEDLFAHYSAIDMDGYRTLKAGQPVTFEVEQGDKGSHAKQIKVLNEQGPAATQPSSASASTSVNEEAESLLAES